MSRNDLSEVGAAEDLLRSIVQMGCAEVHAMTLYFKVESQLENGLVDVTDPETLHKAIGKAEMFQEDIATYADLRRRMTKALMEMFDNEEKDPMMWCQVKHLGIAYYTAMETYQASDDDPELMALAYEAYKVFAKAVTRFLGVEISECASCLSDSLRATTKGEEDGTTNEEL